VPASQVIHGNSSDSKHCALSQATKL